MEFCCPRIKMRDNENINKYLYVIKELKTLRYTKVTVIPVAVRIL